VCPIFSLDEEIIFPHPVLREPDGLLGVGGSLTTERLLLAYRWGIFPWFSKGQPVLWWWTSPRLVIKPSDVHISHSLKNVLNQNHFEVKFNTDFIGVIQSCKSVKRKKQYGSWIIRDIINSYSELHRLGFAHCVEVYKEEKLVGGLYGVALGKIFFGESMFATESNASKVAFVYLCRHLQLKGFEWIDCQQDTPHMRSLGGNLIEDVLFLDILRENQLFMLRSDTSSNF
jgi:leucyl/phenylalanyl-tRNA---protein transferase